MKNMKPMLFKTLGILFALSMGVAVSAAALAADSYPSKVVRIIVPMAAGGGNDITARMIATKMSEGLGKQVIVENIHGGGGVIGVERAAKSAPDGYTLLIINPTTTIQPALHKLPYDLVNSFTPIAKIGSTAHAFAVHPSVPAYSVREFIALAKQKPGQLLMACVGTGTVTHMEMELFKIMADIDFKIVQFKGTSPATIDVLGGHSHAIIGSFPTVVPHIKAGKLRPLGTGGLKRSPMLPDVPTIAEAGLPGYTAQAWLGMLAPVGTPAPIVDRLNKELKAILALEEIQKAFQQEGTEADYLGPAEFGAFYKQQMEQWASVIKKANIKLE